VRCANGNCELAGERRENVRIAGPTFSRQRVLNGERGGTAMDTPEHTSEDTPISEESARDAAGQRYLQQWRATRLIDERTGNSCIGIDFPRRQPGRGFEVFDDDLVEQPKKVRALLKSRGAVPSVLKTSRFALFSEC
jgi:hypothetical protein